MTEPLTAESQRLDDETERLLDAVHCRRPRALPAIRARIRELIEQARKEGVAKACEEITR